MESKSSVFYDFTAKIIGVRRAVRGTRFFLTPSRLCTISPFSPFIIVVGK